MEYEFDTGRVAAPERFEQWREEIARFLVAQDLVPVGPEHFHGRGAVRSVGGVDLLRSRSTQLCSSRGAKHLRQDDDGSLYMLVPQKAEGILRIEGRELEVSPDCVMLLRSDCPFDVRYRGSLDVLFARLPRELLDERIGFEAVPRFLALDVHRPLESILCNALEAAWRIDAAPEQREATGAIVCEVFAGIVNASVGARRLAAESRVSRYLEYVREHLGDPELGAASIAKAHRVSVGTVHKAFRSTGRSAGATIREMRLQRCRAAIASPLMAHRSITEIALHYGFDDPAYFSRVFRRRYGMTPRQIRRAGDEAGESGAAETAGPIAPPPPR